MSIDYRLLLLKYMQYIKDVEGATYVEYDERWLAKNVAFTEEEWEELKELDQERMQRNLKNGGQQDGGH